MRKETLTKLIFYLLLILNVFMFIYSLFLDETFLTLICFVMALLLAHFNKKIPLPAYFANKKAEAEKEKKNGI